jgi:predicted phosphodiesterase
MGHTPSTWPRREFFVVLRRPHGLIRLALWLATAPLLGAFAGCELPRAVDLGSPAGGGDGDEIDLGFRSPLLIGVLGDTRPATPDGPYPLATVTHIYEELARRGPDFVVALGDYVYVTPPDRPKAEAQLTLYRRARSAYPGSVFYVLGNHEAFGENLVAFRQQLSPALYYCLRGTTAAGSWRLVVVADDAWTDVQEAWLLRLLARPAAYTFVARHHPSQDASPRNRRILEILRAAEPTLLVDGHSHLYRRTGDREVTLGNAGAPLSAGFYGYATVALGAEGRVTVRAYRESDDAEVDAFSP